MKRIYFTLFMLIFILASILSSALAQESSPYQVEYQTLNKYKDFRIAIGGGYAFRLGKFEKTGISAIDDMNRQLRHGFTIDADAQYFFKETWGLGLNVNYCSANTSGKNVPISGIGQYANIEETQSFLFVGPSYVARNEGEKFLLLTYIGGGPIFFNTEMNINGQKFNGNKTTIGITAGIGGEYKVSSKIGIGAKLSYVMGSISGINMEGQTVNSYEKISVSNLTATAFISFRTW